MSPLLLVGLGGALGAMARYAAGAPITRLMGPGYPYGTLTINILGGCLMGVLVGWLSARGGGDQERWRLLLGVGVLGGFTTFSAFSLEVALMIERRAYGTALGYSLASVICAVVALFAGLLLMRRVLG